MLCMGAAELSHGKSTSPQRSKDAKIQTPIPNLKLGDKGLENLRSLYSCMNQAQGSHLEVDTECLGAQMGPFNSRINRVLQPFSRGLHLTEGQASLVLWEGVL